MREQRIVWILSELSRRVAECNTTMDMLQDDFNHGRRASMQIRKAAQKCMNDAVVAINRFTKIASANDFDRDCAMVEVFGKRCKKNEELCLFFL